MYFVDELGSNEAMVVGDLYNDAQDGPTIRLVPVSLEGVELLRSVFTQLAAAPVGTSIRFHDQPGVSLAVGIDAIDLMVIEEIPAKRAQRQHVRRAAGRFTWCCSNHEWETACLLLEPFADSASGHQYLTDDPLSDAVIVVSFAQDPPHGPPLHRRPDAAP